jgi:hypothetical protein
MKNDLLQLLSRFKSRLPVATHKDVEELITHGEGGIALENLCQQLFEYDLTVSSDELTEIKVLTERMGLSAKTWSFLSAR